MSSVVGSVGRASGRRRAWQQRQMKHHKVDTIPWGDEKSAIDDDEREEEEKKKSETEAKFKINFMTHFS